MARLKINIDCYQAYILCLIEQQLSQDEIVDRLKHDFDVDISPRTLRNRLSEWKAPFQRSIFVPSPQVKALIAWFFCDIHATNANILANLRSLGYDPAPPTKPPQPPLKSILKRKRQVVISSDDYDDDNGSDLDDGGKELPGDGDYRPGNRSLIRRELPSLPRTA
jgi:hypothetical protein